MTELAQTLGYQIGTMSFTYLGLPLGLSRLTVTNFTPILTRVEKHLMGISKMLTYAGRLILLNSVYSSLPTFNMCTLKLPVEILEQLDKYRKHYLWNEGDLSKKGGCLVAWETESKSKTEIGLGIINLRTQNSAFLLKFMHKFYNKVNLPWVQLTWKCLYRNGAPPHVRRNVGSFWWRDVMSLSQYFFKLATCVASQGDIVAFWNDLWDLGGLKWHFP